MESSSKTRRLERGGRGRKLSELADQSAPEKQLVRWLFLSTAGFFLLAGALVAGIPTDEEAKLDREWEELTQSLRLFEEAFPKVEANASALALEETVSRLGVDLATKGVPGRSRPSRERAREFEAISLPLTEYVGRVAAGPDDRIERVPEPIESFLSAHSEEVHAVADGLHRQDAPRWEMDVRAGPGAPVLNLQGQLNLQKILLATALVENELGRFEDAQWCLEASWQLNQIALARPELMSHILTIAVAKLQAGLLRKLAVPPAVWMERISRQDLRGRVFASLENEALLSAMRAKDQDAKRDTIRTIVGIRKAVAGFLLQNPCAFTREAAKRGWRLLFPADDSGILESVAFPNLSNTVQRLFRHVVEEELTEKILQARSGRLASRDGTWPKEMGSLPSCACPGASWTYRVGEDGTVSIAFNGQFEEWQLPALKLPLAFTAGKAFASYSP